MLTASDREKLQDCLMLVNSARHILGDVREGLVPHVADLEKCFSDADRTLTALLRA